MSHGGAYFHPLFVFFIGCIFFYVIPMFYLGYFDFIYWVIFICAVISFSVGYYASNVVAPYKERVPRYIVSSALPYIGVIAILYLVWAVITYEPINSYAELFQNKSQGAIYSQIFIKLKSMIIVLLASYYASKSRKNYFIISLCFIAVHSMSPTRFHLIEALIYWCAFGVYFKYFKIKLFMVVTALLLSPFIFSILLLKRGMESESGSFFSSFYDLLVNANISQLLELSITSMETFVTFETFTMIIENNFIHPESGIARSFFLFVPRSIWVDKPEAISRIVANEFYSGAYFNGGGMVAGIFGDAYVNGGLLGIILIWFCLGYVCKYIYANTVLRCEFIESRYYKAYCICLYLTFLGWFIMCLRGFMSDFLWIGIFYTLALLSLNKLFSREVYD
ncbi:O-antigen polymerase [Psychromonas sp. SR45-3]|uniref:O-antigen polymerase n=1 Tax=Psychromonas sp. SR45-3 TaxID=2760930 RepID=UPI0015FB0767|nr:O-antigen polymerase [Psychromonas sp. SR45-3]MBB1274708.1 oligosaccharide repeat unit polymerase [Psychromonas sp. SR45-3]